MASNTSGNITNYYKTSNSFQPYDDGTRVAKIKNSRTNHKSGAISDLHNKIANVENYIKSGHDTTAFIYFKVNDFELNTSDPDSFKHYAISLENKKTGVGTGNQFTLKIAYHKQFSHYNSSDVNMLEKNLTQLRNASMFNYSSNNMSNARNDLTKNKCYLKYGYTSNNANLVSPLYEGLLLKYTVNANKQIIEYTLTGYTSDTSTMDTTFNWYPNIKGTENVSTELGTIKRAIIALKGEDASMSDEEKRNYVNSLNNIYSGGLTFQPYLALDCFLQDYNNSSASNGIKYKLIDCTDGKKGRLCKNNTLEPVRMSICRGQTIKQYIEYCIGLFKYKSTPNYALKLLQQDSKTSDRFVYSIVRDEDDPNTNYVCIDVINDNDSDSKVAYNFIGYATDNSLLIDYNLNYDGTVALAVADMYNENTADSGNVIFIDRDGSLRARTSITRDMFTSSEISDVLITKQDTWLDKISCANNCTMTTLGLPFEITVGTVFKCGIYITDTLHHTSGNCFVTGVTDKISNSQFTTEFTMIRLPGKNSSINDIY